MSRFQYCQRSGKNLLTYCSEKMSPHKYGLHDVDWRLSRPRLPERCARVRDGWGRRSGETKVSTTDFPGDQSLLRDNNLALVTRTIFASEKPISRAQISESTGLTKATVSRLVEELIGASIVDKLQPNPTAQQGRPAHLLTPSSSSIAGIGLEINVDLIAGRTLDLQGKILSEFHISGRYRDSDPRQVLTQLSHLASASVSGLRLDGIQIAGAVLAVPGVFDYSTGYLHSAPNLGWNEVPLGALVEEILTPVLEAPVEISNDADQQALCAAFEAPGRLRKDSTFVYIVGDLGIGGAIMSDGVVETGVHGSAGEIGHMRIDPSGPECFCGSRGCLERYAGLSAILAAAGLDPLSNRTDDLITLLNNGDASALKAIDIAVEALSVAIANVVNLLDIPMIILGTGLGRLLPWMEPNLSAQSKQMVIGQSHTDLSIISGNSDATPACSGGAFASLLTPINDPAGWISGPH